MTYANPLSEGLRCESPTFMNVVRHHCASPEILEHLCTVLSLLGVREGKGVQRGEDGRGREILNNGEEVSL